MRPHPRLGSAFALALLLSSGAAAVTAGVPSAVNSTVPPCLIACPAGDISFDIVVRDLVNNPEDSSLVVLDFSECPGAYLCDFPDTYIVDLPTRTIRKAADLNGFVHFPLHVGGGCAANTVRVFADGVLLARRSLASPDQDGDGFTYNIINNDFVLFSAKLGTSDPTADLDCDGDVDGDDQTIFFAHAATTCQGFVDAARRSTWGRLKSHYR